MTVPVAGRERYETPEGAARYAARSPARGRVEEELVARALEALGGDRTLLDAPCGVGRMSRLASARGLSVLALDASSAMLERSRAQGVARRYVRADLAELPFKEGVVDAVLCFRLFHHLRGGEDRRRLFRELGRVARRHVAVSFFHPVSFHHALRLAKRLWGVRSMRSVVTLGRLRAEAAAEGLRLERWWAQSPYRRDLWLALFEKAY
jgi:SAM-dependent methyltransferase